MPTAQAQTTLLEPPSAPSTPPPPPHGRTEFIPPEGAGQLTQGEARPTNPHANDPHLAGLDEATFDLDNGPTGRFDPPAPLELETRGITSHASQPLTTRPEAPGQREFWHSQTAHKFSIAAKLRAAGRQDIASALEYCHSTFTVALCPECGKTSKFPNRCDRHYCPECQPRLAHERRDSIEWWTKEVKQPKHVVLTLKNIPTLTKPHVQEAKAMLANLRRRAFTTKLNHWWEHNATGHREPIKTWRPQTETHHTVSSYPWLGGFYSMEVTNEGRGWHIHFHLLVDCRYIDAAELARQWAKSTRGFGYIVKVMDARDKSYLHELTKYTVKGSQLAEWQPADIVSFIEAFDGVRTFGVFGSLYGKRTEFAEWLEQMRDHKPQCDCGCAQLRYFSEAEWLDRDLQPATNTRSRPPTSSHQQQELLKRETAYTTDERLFLR